MSAREATVSTFPSARIPSQCGGLPVEVTLIAQLGHGSGDQLFASTLPRQQAHDDFTDELDEPSAKLGATDFAKGDATALYTFSVGPQGHPFHRHAGHRVFTAISGSGGAQLRFSTASLAQIEQDPHSFLSTLRHVDIPPDCLFSVRFGGQTWHQFAPLQPGSPHPVLFALSCHTNELGGTLEDATRTQVLAGEANIHTLTELLPASVQQLLQRNPVRPAQIPTIALSLNTPACSLQNGLCSVVRAITGNFRSAIGQWHKATGFIVHRDGNGSVEALPQPPPGSLLRMQLSDRRIHHEDTFRLTIHGTGFAAASASELLGQVLRGFLSSQPVGVSGLMRLRNVLVKPLRLRTSPLGCPAASLLSPMRDQLFDGRFPVLDQAIDAADTRAQVILGVDDRHLMFRSCIGVEIVSDSRIDFTLGTRVHCLNAFGRTYIAAIELVHRKYVTPAMLRAAVAHASEEARVPLGPLLA